MVKRRQGRAGERHKGRARETPPHTHTKPEGRRPEEPFGNLKVGLEKPQSACGFLADFSSLYSQGQMVAEM